MGMSPKRGFFEISISMATRWHHCHFYISLIYEKSRKLLLKVLIGFKVHTTVLRQCYWFLLYYYFSFWERFQATKFSTVVNLEFLLFFFFLLVYFIFTVGSPIPVEKVENPTQETIDKLHSRYIEDIKELYKKYVKAYHPTDKSELLIV